MKSILTKDTALSIGEIKKKHGFDGSFVLTLNSKVKNLSKKIAQVWIEKDEYIVPWKIEFVKQKNDDEYIVKLFDFNHEKDLEQWMGHEVFADKNAVILKRGISVDGNELEDFSVEDTNSNFKGIIKTIVENPFQVLLEVESEGKIYLIPLAEDLVEELIPEKKTIKMNLPEGLLNINDV